MEHGITRPPGGLDEALQGHSVCLSASSLQKQPDWLPHTPAALVSPPLRTVPSNYEPFFKLSLSGLLPQR